MTRRIAPLLLVAFLATPARAHVYRESVQRTIPVDGATVIRVTNPNGLVRIRPAEGSEIQLVAKKIARAGDEDEARLLASRARVSVAEGPEEVRIKVEVPSRKRQKSGLAALFGFVRRSRVAVDLFLDVPEGMRIELTTASGDIDVEGMRAGGEVSATSGDVWLSDCRGDFSISVASGDVEIEAVEGKLRLSSASGELSVRDIAGPVSVSVASGDFDGADIEGSFALDGASGDVNLERCEGEIEVSTASGDVWFEDVVPLVSVSTSSGDVTVSTAGGDDVDVGISCSSGDIELELPRGASYTLKISTVSGMIHTSVPLSIENLSRHELRGKVGSGRGSVRLSTSSGDIVVDER